MEQFARLQMLLGEDAPARLAGKSVAVFGIGGVGGYAAEGLCRSGIGHIDVIDGDSVSVSNLNRQIIATHATIGQNKALLMQQRIKDINPACSVRAFPDYYTEQTADQFDLSGYDYILDCVDMVSAKILLAVEAQRLNLRLISAMGAGNKLDLTKLRISDLAQSSVCPLARVMRKELRQRGITNLTVAYSTEPAIKPCATPEEGSAARRAQPGSLVFVPAAMGLMMAGHVTQSLLGLI